MDGQMDEKTDGQIEKGKTDWQTDIWTDQLMDGQTDRNRQKDRQMGGQKTGQTDWQTDGWTDSAANVSENSDFVQKSDKMLQMLRKCSENLDQVRKCSWSLWGGNQHNYVNIMQYQCFHYDLLLQKKLEF